MKIHPSGGDRNNLKVSNEPIGKPAQFSLPAFTEEQKKCARIVLANLNIKTSDERQACYSNLMTLLGDKTCQQTGETILTQLFLL